MSTTIAAVKGSSEVKQTLHHHDPADATVATKLAWVAMKNFEWLLAAVMVTSAHALVTVKLFAATDDSGAGATEIKAHAAPTVADALGDVVYIECTADQAKDVLPAFTHIGVEIDMNHADATAVVSMLRGGAKRKHDGLTADQIA